MGLPITALPSCQQIGMKSSRISREQGEEKDQEGLKAQMTESGD
jgi:hypothetical protein